MGDMPDMTFNELRSNLDQFFLLVMGMIVLFMQCGFAFLEAGAVRSKNTTNILIKNALDQFISGIAYWMFGYAFAFGDLGNGFISYWNFCSSYLPESGLAFFFFQFVFAATAATIVSGALAERCHFVAYLVYSFFLTAFIYPVATHWVWDSKGWLLEGFEVTMQNQTSQIVYHDFAGSSVVHIIGGIAAFSGAALMGPRLGRYNADGELQPIRGHSVPMAALGGFILFFGFLAFNGGSQASIATNPEDGPVVGLAIVNTVICGSFSAITTLLFNRFGIGNEKKWSLLISINGGLTGMVAACAGANVYHPWLCPIVGVFASTSFLFFSWAMHKIKVDDPLDAVAVHFGGGWWGVIAVAFFHRGNGLVYQLGSYDLNRAGLFLAWQITGAAAVTAWGLATCVLMFGGLKLIGYLRVSEEIEIKEGLDIAKHGEPAYPLEAYGNGWIESMRLLEAFERNTVPGRETADMFNAMSREHPEIMAMSGNFRRIDTQTDNGHQGMNNPGYDMGGPVTIYVNNATKM